MTLKDVVIIMFVLVSGLGLGIGVERYILSSEEASTFISPIIPQEIKKPLLRYSFSELQQRAPQHSPLQLMEVQTTTDEYTSYVFHFTSEGKKISGLMNVPTKAQSLDELPVIVMFRGFVPEESYFIGAGTQRAGEVFARQGYVTIAMDFLEYGESDPQPVDSLEARFIKVNNSLDLLASIEEQNEPLSFESQPVVRFDSEKLGIWGHSNGGQIVLSILEITGKSYPTVLWAPVTKPFPYSILYFTDESEDHGKYLRSIIADFEDLYNIDDFSIGYHLDQITSPIQLHQGSNDMAVPKYWSDQFVGQLKKLKKDKLIEYFVYPGADHNLMPDWNTAVNRSVSFFDRELTSIK